MFAPGPANVFTATLQGLGFMMSVLFSTSEQEADVN